MIPRPKNPTLEEVKQKEEAQQKHAKDVVKYKSHIEKAIKKLQESFKDYERNPQQHPMYVKEWKMFWSRKFKEVLEKGKDANSYDYIPEWTAFWNERVQDLHRMDVEKVKEELRKQFGLSFKEVEAINKLEKSAEQNEEPTSLSANFPFSKHQLIVEEPVESLFSELSFCHNKENDLEPIVSYEVLGGPENLAALCQLLMKFIPELGLFAEAIYDLLGKSVALERVKQNSSNELLLSVGNCNVLETVKEKLEGISTVNMIAPNKFFEVKRAVNSITTLLNEGCSRKSVSSSSEVKKRDCESVDLQRDIKMEISTRIAELLTTQDGMTLSSEELDAWVETLINENFVDFPDVKKVKKSET